MFKIGILQGSMYCRRLEDFLWNTFKSITNKAIKTVWNVFVLAFMIPTEMKEINISSLLITFNKFETWCCVTSEFYTLLFPLSQGQVVTRQAAAWPNKQRNGKAATRPLLTTWPGDRFKCFVHSAYKSSKWWYHFSPFFWQDSLS